MSKIDYENMTNDVGGVIPLITSDWMVENTLLPNGGSQMITAVKGDDIYVIGGAKYESNTNLIGKYTRKYNITTNTWTTLNNSIPNIIQGTHRGLVLGNYIYVVGYNRDFYRYDITANTWSTMTGLPYDASWCGTLIYQDTLYIFGGHSGKTSVYYYNVNSNGWIFKSSLPFNFNYGDVAEYNGEVYIIGGEESLTSIYKYDMTNGTCTKLNITSPLNLRFHSCVSTPNGIYILGGMMKGDNQPALSQCLLFEGTNIEVISDLPIPVYQPGAVFVNNTIYVFYNEYTLTYSFDNGEYRRCYLYEVDNKLCNEINGELVELEGVELTEQSMLEYGNSTFNAELLASRPHMKLHIYEQNPSVIEYSFNYTLLYKGQLIVQGYDFNATNPSKLIITAIVNMDDIFRVLLSNDSGENWYTYVDGEVTPSSLDLIEEEGLSNVQINALLETHLNALTSETGKLRLAIYMKQARSNVKMKLNHIRLEYKR